MKSFRIGVPECAVSKLGLALVVLSIAPSAWSSSHREAPAIAMNPSVDATDLYMFRSYEPARAGFVTVLA
ncbi:MAG: DUF4331 family protein, partial [Caldimonas sp.]